MVFQFECTSSTTDPARLGKFTPKPVDMEFVKNTLIKYQHGLNDRSWNALFVENHDLGRCINRFGELKFYDKSAKAIAIMNYFLKGTPYIYQGQELGMTNIKITDVNDYDDVEVHGFYKEYVLDKKLLTYEEFMDGCNKEARDNNRTPIQWSDEVNAGWNEGAKPWLKINPNYTEINAKKQINDPDSIFSFYKKLIAVRKHETYRNTFVYGKFNAHQVEKKNVFIYTRESEDAKILVVTNMRGNTEEVVLPFEISEVLLSNYNHTYENKITLEPYEAFVAVIK